MAELLASDQIKKSEKQEIQTYLSALVSANARTSEPLCRKLHEFRDKLHKRQRQRDSDRTKTDQREFTDWVRGQIGDTVGEEIGKHGIAKLPGGGGLVGALNELQVPIWLGQFAGGLMADKKARDAGYRRMIGPLRQVIRHYGRDSRLARQMLEALANMAQFGAKRQNFRREYVDNPKGWERLPDNPEDMPYGYWN
jgi:hypothetical protein